ncbi:MAG: nicotinate-nucleotide--dimethylbenzimidazole phosphoribosyltransferase [Eubacteriaceae bacterium]|nr:nicotinate-nucleotide--dimethylbenzimidazole phosphoribosyltransferase [Eubacteriaceae bacterium]
MEFKKEIEEAIASIEGANIQAMEAAEAYSLGLAKIPGSLGRVEDIAIKLSGITGKVKNAMPKKCVIIMSSDNDIALEGVSSAPQDVTAALTEIFADMVTGVGVMARVSGSDVIVYDVGVKQDIQNPKVINKKIRYAAGNFKNGPAMEPDECMKAIKIGIDAALDAKEKGYDVIGTGEMGIGNTSSTTCVTALLTGASVDDLVGKGTGMSEASQLDHKINTLKAALEHNQPNQDDVFDVITKVGGLDIAALTGLYIGAAMAKVPVVIDGYISSVAALCAWKLNPKTYDYMIESHSTAEPGYKAIRDAMGLKPMFDMNMRLGEGSGCPLAFFVVDCANSMMNHMFTFEQSDIGEEYTDKIPEFEF